jgi:rhodanese-related sulfurtransferase
VALFLQSKGYQVLVIKGGYKAWLDAGFSVQPVYGEVKDKQ